MKLIFLLLTIHAALLCKVVDKQKDPNGGYVYTVVKLRPPYVPTKSDTGKVFTNQEFKVGAIIKFN